MSNACLRYFNVYGPRQDEKSQYAAAIPKFISCAKKREPLTIYGTGKQTRDFTYVDDVARANLLALKNKAEGVFNIGSGRNTSIIELANLVEELTGRKLVRHYKPARPEDVLDSLADISRAEATFGYGPMFDLRTGLRKMIASSD